MNVGAVMRVLLLLTFGAWTAAATAQQADKNGKGAARAIEQPPAGQRPSEQPSAERPAMQVKPLAAGTARRQTFWPPDFMVKAWLTRTVNEVSRRHNLSPDQGRKLFELYAQRIPKFMEQNRENLEPVLTEVAYSFISGEAPSAERMAHLANAAKPLVEKTQELIHGVFDDFKGELNPTQVVRMQAEMTAMDMAMKLTSKKLDDWAEGKYDPATSLPGLRAPAEMIVAGVGRPDVWSGGTTALAAGSAARALASDPQDRLARTVPTQAQKDRFDKYVEEFIAKYDLDTAQQKMAYSILADIKQRAEPAERKSRKRIAAIEAKEQELAAKAKAKELSDEELKAAKERLAKERELATSRVNKLFDELRKRLKFLPTSRQRKMVDG